MNLAQQILAISIALTLALSGCTMLYEPPSPPKQKFYGIHPISHSTPAIEMIETNLVTIHGMCHNSTQWITDNADRLSKMLNMPKVSSLNEVTEFNTETAVTLHKITLSDDRYKVNLYGIIYSGETITAKKQLCTDVEDKNSSPACSGSVSAPYPYERANLNSVLKDVLLNDCLADAIIYFGDKQISIQQGVQDALLAISRNIGPDRYSNSPTLFISESLGSKVLRDAVLCRDEKPDLKQFLNSSVQIFTASNQIPILNLASSEEMCSEASFVKRQSAEAKSEKLIELQEYKGSILDIFSYVKKSDDKTFTIKNVDPDYVRLVSFSDPSDLLSYFVSAEDYGIDEFQLESIAVSNSPTYFGFVTHPQRSHRGYRENQSVLKLMACGNNSKTEQCLTWIGQ